MTEPDTIAVLDFGGQYAHLITNRIRRLGVHAVIRDHDTPAEELKTMKGLILSGGPQSVNAEESLLADPQIFELGLPILGICYGHQVTNKLLGGTVSPGHTKEYGMTKLVIDRRKGLFKGLDKEALNVWMSHWDEVTEIPVGFEVLGHTPINDFAAVGNFEKQIYGIQFHPEVTHTEEGMKILDNFVEITGAERSWNSERYLEQISEAVTKQVQASGRKVFMLVSGGVDSMVAFTLLNKVLGEDQVTGLLVDTGFMRKGEITEVTEALDKLGYHNLHVADAKDHFYEAIKGIADPEEKRAIIGKTFLEIQAKTVKDLQLDPDHWLLGQGTIYPDTIESGSTKHADKIKTHHNRVPEIQEMMDKGLIIEPLADLYKDEVRLLGEKIGLPHHLVWRHPFPGPGLAIRMLCTPHQPSKPEDLHQDEQAVNELLQSHNLAAKILPIQSVGVQGDARTYRHPVALFPSDEKTWTDHWRFAELQDISTELTNRFESINRVLFTLSPEAIHTAEILPNRYLTPDRVQQIQEADAIVMNEVMRYDDQERTIWQCPTVLLPLAVNEQEEESLLIRPISSIDAMTANFALIPPENLNKIIVQMKELNPSAIFYDLTNKPPGTIEWE